MVASIDKETASAFEADIEKQLDHVEGTEAREGLESTGGEPAGELAEALTEEPVYDRGVCWIVCVSAMLLNANTWGMNSGFAIYFSTYINDGTFPGATKLDYAAIGGLSLAAVLATPVINYLQGILGYRGTLIIGNCVQFTALILSSFSKKLWQLYLTQGLLQGVGLAMCAVPAILVIPQFFKKKRVLASGLGAAGTGLGGIVYNVGMQKIVEKRSVFWALRAQAIISFGLINIAIVLFRSRTKLSKTEFTLFDRLVAKNPAYHLLIFYGVTCMFGYVLTLYTITNHTTSLGYTAYQGSVAAAMMQVGALLGRPLVGFVADKMGPVTVTAYCYMLTTVFCAAMSIPARNYATILAYAIIMGSIMGTFFGTIGPIIAKLVGLGKLNIALGMLWPFIGAACMTSPVIGVSLISSGAAQDPSRYNNCTIFASVSFFACACSLVVLRGYILARDELLQASPHDAALLTIAVPRSAVLRHLLRPGRV